MRVCVCACTYNSTIHSPFPRAVATTNHGAGDLVPESGVLYWVDGLLWVDVQVDTLHDTAERCSETKGKMNVLHTPVNRVKGRDDGRRRERGEKEGGREGRREKRKEGEKEGGRERRKDYK